MTDNEQTTILIDNYTNLQRIKASPDRDKEIDYQIKTTKSKLEAIGVMVEDLNLE